MTTHNIYIAYSSDRVTRFSHKSRNAQTTIGWRTRCSCGEIVETKQNSYAKHKIKVQKHLELVEAK
jgi:hypothetical protein